MGLGFESVIKRVIFYFCSCVTVVLRAGRFSSSFRIQFYTFLKCRIFQMLAISWFVRKAAVCRCLVYNPFHSDEVSHIY